MNAKVITNWQPSRLDERTIRREFLQLCRREGLDICGDDFEVRSPRKHGEAPLRKLGGDPSFDWHRDTTGDGVFIPEHQPDRYIVMWSNVLPTEVAAGYERLRARDGDVLLVDNLTTKHRIPKGVEHANRWFIRAHIHKQ